MGGAASGKILQSSVSCKEPPLRSLTAPATRNLELTKAKGAERMSRQITVLIIGAGSRGKSYASYALYFPARMKVIGVADPRAFARQELQEAHHIDEGNVFDGWKAAAEREKFADAVVIATPDRLHKAPALAFAQKGYHILLEKPMAVTPEDCKEIVMACKTYNCILAVCHVLRYHPVSRKIKELLDAGLIGDICHIQHLEPVLENFLVRQPLPFHKRPQDMSEFLLVGGSHGGGAACFLGFPVSMPQGAASRCLDCPVEQNCPYSAQKIYLKPAEKGGFHWPVSVVCSSGKYDIEALTDALRHGPYGRCVYECDNDVVSNQVVNMEFEGGTTAAFTMVAFTERLGVRKTTVYGTKGQLSCKGSGPVKVFDFLQKKKLTFPADAAPSVVGCLSGHGGADYCLMDAFVSAVADNNPSLILTGAEETLNSHLLVFEAERSRKENRVVFLET